ncbi:MAG: hypothetical protein AAGA21_15800 [Pseudomonadota bacterium]
MTIASSYPIVSKLIGLHCDANAFDLDGFRDHLAGEKWKKLNPTFLADFQKVIDERLMTIKEYEDLTNEDFDTEDELYEHLQEVHDYISRDG